jgi:hypothetical protein
MNEVFVLGAGASKAVAELPLGNELIWNYHADCTLLNPIINGRPVMTQGNKQVSNEFYEFLDLASNIYPKLESIKNKFKSRDILYIFTHIVNEKKYFVDEILKEIQKKRNHEGVLLLKKLILKHLDNKSFALSNAYKDFIEKVLLNNSANDISIISFNFDYLLNDYYGNGIDNEVYFDYLLHFDHKKNGYKHKNLIPLIKLHGSLDWGLCNECNELRLYFPHKVADKYFGNSWPPICNSGGSSCNGIIEPYIFLPHQKLDDRIELLWNEATKKLKNAPKVTIIGYSFPDYDEKAIDLFKNALNPNVKLQIVDHCNGLQQIAKKQIKNKFKRMFPHLQNEIEICLCGFKKYLASYNN